MVGHHFKSALPTASEHHTASQVTLRAWLTLASFRKDLQQRVTLLPACVIKIQL